MKRLLRSLPVISNSAPPCSKNSRLIFTPLRFGNHHLGSIKFNTITPPFGSTYSSHILPDPHSLISVSRAANWLTSSSFRIRSTASRMLSNSPLLALASVSVDATKGDEGLFCRTEPDDHVRSF